MEINISYTVREIILFILTLFFIFAMSYGPIIADLNILSKKHS